jgi:hypothetical protein
MAQTAITQIPSSSVNPALSVSLVQKQRAGLSLKWLKMVFISFLGFRGSFEAYICF